MFEYASESKILSQWTTILIWIASIVFYQFCNMYACYFRWNRILIFCFILLINNIQKYYKKQSLSIGHGTVFHRNVRQNDIFTAMSALFIHIIIPVIVYFCYRPDIKRLNTPLRICLVSVLQICAFLAGYFFSYYSKTYKQNLRSFRYINTLKKLMMMALVFSFYIQYKFDVYYIFLTPISFMYTIGAFFDVFTSPKTSKIVYFCFALFILGYFCFDLNNKVRIIQRNFLLRL